MKILKEDRILFSYLLTLGILISACSVYFTQAEDMGLFLTVGSLVSKGYKLYREIFEIKDPIFFYSAAGMLKIFGLRGPFLIDIVLITISPILSYLALRNLDFKKEVSFASSIFFTLSLTGTFYQPFRTQILGIIVLVLAVVFSGKNNFLVGIFISMIFFTKMSMMVFSPIVIMIIYYKTQILRKEILSTIFGFLTHTVILITIMQIRGEFIPYLSMVGDNFNYAKDYQKIVGLPDGIIGHFKLWNSNYQSLTYYVFTIVLLIFSFKLSFHKPLNRLQISSLITVNLSTILFLGLTNLWVHHLQILAVSSLFNFASIFQIIIDQFTSNNFKINSEVNKKIILKTNKNKLYVSCLIWVLATVCIVDYSGFLIPTKPRMNLEKWMTPNWVVPPEIIHLNASPTRGSSKITVGRLGMNDDLGYGAFFDPKRFSFRCNRSYIAGFESIAVEKTFLSCIKNDVEILTVGPMFDGINRPYGNYNWFKSEANQILTENFNCNSKETNSYRICFRKL